MFENDTCKMVQGVLELLRGVCIGTFYNFLGRIVSNGCSSSFIVESGAKEGETPTSSRENTMLWHQTLGNI